VTINLGSIYWEGISCSLFSFFSGAIAKVLAMIADAFPEPVPQSRCPARESDETLWETATDFCAAMDRYAWRARGGLRVVRD
jgi:hypothetical protein